MSLVENIARRNYSPTELLQGIKQLKDKGYSSAEIACKTGFTAEYINQISKLLFRGEERLINAVYTDRIPLNVAIDVYKRQVMTSTTISCKVNVLMPNRRFEIHFEISRIDFLGSSKTKIKWRNYTFFFIFINTYWSIRSLIGFSRIIHKIIFLNNICLLYTSPLCSVRKAIA